MDWPARPQHPVVGTDMVRNPMLVGSQLCVACRACCDGTLFGHALLKSEDADHVARLKLPVLNDGSGFRHPCPRLETSGCTVYEEPRPEVCGAFKCNLLQDVQEGRLSLAGAMLHVVELQRLALELKARLGTPPTASLSAALARETKSIVTSLDPSLLLLVMGLRQVTQRHFVQPKPE